MRQMDSLFGAPSAFAGPPLFGTAQVRAAGSQRREVPVASGSKLSPPLAACCCWKTPRQQWPVQGGGHLLQLLLLPLLNLLHACTCGAVLASHGWPMTPPGWAVARALPEKALHACTQAPFGAPSQQRPSRQPYSGRHASGQPSGVTIEEVRAGMCVDRDYLCEWPHPGHPLCTPPLNAGFAGG
jgi:hypothetical protein